MFLFHSTTYTLPFKVQSYPCPPPPPPPPRRNTAPTIFALGTHTRKSRRPTFIPSNITTPTAKNTPNYTQPTSWFSATTSPKSRVGTGRRVGPHRIVPIRTDMSMSAPERSTRYTVKPTHSSRILASKFPRWDLEPFLFHTYYNYIRP